MRFPGEIFKNVCGYCTGRCGKDHNVDLSMYWSVNNVCNCPRERCFLSFKGEEERRNSEIRLYFDEAFDARVKNANFTVEKAMDAL